MSFFDMNSEVANLHTEEERILASFTRRLIEIAAVAGARGSGTSATAALNAMRLPAIAFDQHGFVVYVNAVADVVFDDNIKIKDRRLFVRDPDARRLLKVALDQLKTPPRVNSLALEPVTVPRTEKLPVIVRIWPFEGPSQEPVECLGTQARAARGDPRQNVRPDPFGSEARQHISPLLGDSLTSLS
jgi:hypothetical protein